MTNFIFPRSHLAGLKLTTAGSSATFGVAAGQCTDDANTVIMNANSAFTKTTAAWAEGTGGGALLDAGSILASISYHVFAMQRPDTLAVDYGVSTSPTPTLPGAYTTSRRIGSMFTDASSHWTKFIQDGDRFRYTTRVESFNATGLGVTETTRTVNVPTGVRLVAILAMGVAPSIAGQDLRVYVGCPDEDAISGSPNSSMTAGASGMAASTQTWSVIEVQTNASAQIVTKNVGGLDSGSAIICETIGWIDRRGKDA